MIESTRSRRGLIAGKSVAGRFQVSQRDLTVRVMAAEAEVRLYREKLDRERKEARELVRDAAVEARWQERQGEDYGTY